MLHVTYEAVPDLAPGRLATIDEDRGELLIKLDKTQPLKRVVRQLNIEMAQFLSRADWFQLWGKEILSRHVPATPLQVRYLLDPTYPALAPGIAESRGIVRVYINPVVTTEQFAAGMNPAVRNLLDGGCWFQLYGGEIIDMSPEPVGQV